MPRANRRNLLRTLRVHRFLLFAVNASLVHVILHTFPAHVSCTSESDSAVCTEVPVAPVGGAVMLLHGGEVQLQPPLLSAPEIAEKCRVNWRIMAEPVLHQARRGYAWRDLREYDIQPFREIRSAMGDIGKVLREESRTEVLRVNAQILPQTRIPSESGVVPD